MRRPARRSHALLVTACLIGLLGGSLLRAQEPPPAEPPPLEPPTAMQPAPGETQPAAPVPESVTGTEPPGAAATPPAPAVPVPPAAPAAPPEGSLDFNLQFPPEQGGGSAAGSANSLEYVRDDYAVLMGEVKIKYQDLELSADAAEIDLKTRIVNAHGHVILDQGPRRLTGESLVFDLGAKTGTLKEATGQVKPDYYFVGREVIKTGADTYVVVDGTFTSCSQAVPDWSFRLGRATIEVEGYSHIRSASMRVKKAPVFYFPYLIWPVKSERSAGLLIPNIGYSDRRGGELGLAYFQPLGRSYDTTVHVDLFTKSYLGIGNEFRYRPSENTVGRALGYVIQDPETDEWRWKLQANHTSNQLPFGMRGVVNYEDYSDFNFFRDFERDLDRNAQRSIYSQAFVSGNWGPHLVNLLADDRQTIVGGTGGEFAELRKLPSLEYRLRSTRVGRTPLYIQGQGSVAYLDLQRPDSYSGSYGRVDLFPQLSLPLRTFPWLSVTPTTGARLTYYSDSRDTLGQNLTGEPLTRAVPIAGLEIVGPSFSRIFDGFGSFSKVKHLIQPRWTYSYSREFEEVDEVPVFDEIDTSIFTNNSGRLALANRFLGKSISKDPLKPAGSAREFLLVEIARNYSFDEDTPLLRSQDGTLASQAGPIEGLIRFSPTDRTNLRFETVYDTLFKAVTGTAFSGNLGYKTHNFGLSWVVRKPAESQIGQNNRTDQIRFNSAVTVIPRRLQLEAQINYDLEDQGLQSQRYVANFNSQCYGLRLEFRNTPTFRDGMETQDKEIRFSLSLKNVGTFLDLTSRSSQADTP
jgi:LPS-assembly protein